MLVDYHLHLAPDGVALGAAELSAARVAEYGDTARERRIDHICLTEHCHRFRQAAGLLDHPFWAESAKADLDAYVAAGSQVILTNTFSSNRILLEKHGLADRAFALSKAGAEISKRAAQQSFTAKLFSETTRGVLRFLFDLKGRACMPPEAK